MLYLALVQGQKAMAAWLLGTLLAHPAGLWYPIAGALVLALVTRVIGSAPPPQLLLRFKPPLSFEAVLTCIGHSVILFHLYIVVPHMFLPGVYATLPWLAYTAWYAYTRVHGG